MPLDKVDAHEAECGTEPECQQVLRFGPHKLLLSSKLERSLQLQKMKTVNEPSTTNNDHELEYLYPVCVIDILMTMWRVGMPE